MKNGFLGFILPIALLSASCNTSPETSVLADGGEVPPLPTTAVKEPMGDGFTKVAINDNNGFLLEQGDYFGGLREGTWTEYFTNGFPKTITGYVGGRKHGTYVLLDNRGQLLERRSRVRSLHKSVWVFCQRCLPQADGEGGESVLIARIDRPQSVK